VLWTDPGGYDAYRTERRFADWNVSDFEDTLKETQENRRLKKQGTEVDSPNRYSIRFAPTTRRVYSGAGLTDAEFNKVRGGGWPLELLQQKVDQFVYHYDVAASSRGCFKTLQDDRDLSVHFMLDLDGTIYQTLDVKERAWHATKANNRSVGIEICNIGAYPPARSKTLDEFYRKDEKGQTRLVLPAYAKSEWIRTPNFVGHPARPEAVIGTIQKTEYRMYDLTPQQYDSLIKLSAALCTVLPRIAPDYPRDSQGHLITRVLDDQQWENYHGLLGHYHVQENKQDPGPAFQFDKVINGTRALMGKKPLPSGDTINNPPKQTMAQK